MAVEELSQRMKVYQATAIFSVLFALLGFSYNVWRMEVTERNSNVRSASFELLLQLAELEQLVYAAHYDQDSVDGNPRVGWVKVGLIVDLSVNGDAGLQLAAQQLRDSWAQHWEQLPVQRDAADAVVVAIDTTRAAVQALLFSLD